MYSATGNSPLRKTLGKSKINFCSKFHIENGFYIVNKLRENELRPIKFMSESTVKLISFGSTQIGITAVTTNTRPQRVFSLVQTCVLVDVNQPLPWFFKRWPREDSFSVS